MLIFFDIDGTLLIKPFDPMPASTIRAIEQARANGHVCMINTGRSLKLVGEEITGQTEFDGLLLGCGTMITYRGEVLLHKTFTEEEAKRIIEGLQRHGIDAVLEGAENNFLAPKEEMFHACWREYIGKFTDMSYGTYEEAPEHFDKFYAYVEDRAKMDAFMQEFADLLDVVDRSKGYFELMPKGCSKASAMEYVAEYLGIPMVETVAIGDGANDIPMLECAHCAIVMGNAPDTVKKLADYVTTDVDKDGIENALKWLGVIYGDSRDRDVAKRNRGVLARRICGDPNAPY